MGRAFWGVVLFTVLEAIGFEVWIVGSNVHITLFGRIGLYVFLLLEHYVSVNVGNGRAPFGPLPPNR